jgi:hypothetical protein
LQVVVQVVMDGALVAVVLVVFVPQLQQLVVADH